MAARGISVTLRALVPDFLIDRALQKSAAAQPVRLGDEVEVTPQEGLVYVVYSVALDAARGRCEQSDVVEYSRKATQAGVAQVEVDAAIARAEADASSGG